jgi:hypothetical protein
MDPWTTVVTKLWKRMDAFYFRYDFVPLRCRFRQALIQRFVVGNSRYFKDAALRFYRPVVPMFVSE